MSINLQDFFPAVINDDPTSPQSYYNIFGQIIATENMTDFHPNGGFSKGSFLFQGEPYLGGGFNHFFYFHPEPWADDPIWRAYFSDGLKLETTN